MVDSLNDTPAVPRLPWEFHPALTEDRLRLCARLLANARRDAVALAPGVQLRLIQDDGYEGPASPAAGRDPSANRLARMRRLKAVCS